ncbi:putative retinol dehydrogenase [Phialemonium atrogriseum]|uniref:Retinol dehydrogenase n=1 Tax=Phialemonium atrogriseum TaxID=1093897 RepID=A0AAJ0BYV3_9PEZI|nr:putative retinol dehydrogenase [Phialemonium atrogriseum]KAK1766786.1 putative retinol dehydrogenase [Phialemonium atrogriseum]
MPIPFIASIFFDGAPSWMPKPWNLVKTGSALAAAILTKRYCSGATNTAERSMHGRVVMITGGTSGVGQAVALELAERGAQIILLTHLPAADPFLADYVDDLRDRTNNQLIYAEQVDLSSLHSIRQFATKWIDNAPPRRLDMVILCAATLTPPGAARTETAEGLESTWMVNYLANFHLLGILSPAIRAQPFDRDVRIIIPTCPAYISSPPLAEALDKDRWTPGKAYARSKLALAVFGQAYQKHLDAYKRPDELPMNARVVFVDPGLTRTPGTRRWLTRGSLLGLIFYMLFYVLVWLFLKSPGMGAQSILFAAMDASLGRGPGGKLVKECMEVDFARKDVKDDEVAKKLWESSDKLIEKVEKGQAVKRARMKKDQEKREEEAKEAERMEEIESLVDTIKKGKEKKAQKARNRKKREPDGKAVP